MTEQTQPTDAELEACPFCGNANAIVYDDLLTFHAGCLSCGATGSVSSYRNGAIAAWNRRAVLAKWGTPAGAEEVVAWLSTDSIGERYLCFTKPKDTDPARPLVFGDTTPQPTQAQAGFKSGAKSFQTYAEANAYSKGYYAGKKAATKAQAGAAPMSQPNRLTAYSAAEKLRELGYYWDEKAESWVRGIKGGQHGAE
ncbi:Lar family restriction alleviation protein [Acidovorax facilis]|uniref:Lar family restriction alleviation protein n=1 Tax=Acidovorax facilis TaxID=12917 RepID=A0ABV8DAV9_9BURK|nr:Lar family restriction alleviation protein [Acidovorax facilis]MCO4240913.1 Lar family restriction alleviation protein [Acidovorax facilis]